MRVLLFLASFLCVMVAGAQPAATRAENGLLYLDQKDFRELKALDSAEFDPAAVYQERILLVVDFFNCLACNYYLSKTLENTGDIPVVILVKNLPPGQLDAFRQEFRINPASKVVASPKYQYFLNRTFSDKDKSFVLRYYSQMPIVKYANILDQAQLTQLLRPVNKLAYTPVSCDTVTFNMICNGVVDLAHIGDDYFFIADPAMQLTHIDKERKASLVSIPESIIRDSIFERIWKEELLPVQREFNSYEISMKLQEKDYDPMGIKLYQFSGIESDGDTLYAMVTFAMPYKKFHNMLWQGIYHYISAFDREGNLLSLKRQDTCAYQPYFTWPDAGFKGNDDKYLTAVGAKDTLTYFKERQIIFSQAVTPAGNKKYTMPRDMFLPYWSQLREGTTTHRYMNDTQLYFEYIPYGYSLKTGKFTHYPQLPWFYPSFYKNKFAFEHQGYAYLLLQAGYYQVMAVMGQNRLFDFKVLDWRFAFYGVQYTRSAQGLHSLEINPEGKMLLKTYRLP